MGEITGGWTSEGKKEGKMKEERDNSNAVIKLTHTQEDNFQESVQSYGIISRWHVHNMQSEKDIKYKKCIPSYLSPFISSHLSLWTYISLKIKRRNLTTYSLRENK